MLLAKPHQKAKAAHEEQLFQFFNLRISHRYFFEGFFNAFRNKKSL